MRFIIVIAVALVLVPNAYAQLAKQKKWKIGLNRLTTGVTYKYETEYLENQADTTTSEISKSSSGDVSNTELMIEYIFAGRFGLEFNLNLTPGIRNYSFETNNEKIGDIVESVQSGFLFGSNLYFSDHSADGFKFFAGLLTGSFTVTHVYSNGGDRPASLTSEQEALLADNFKSSQTSSKTVPVQIIKLGMDWIRESVGFRAQFITVQASETVTSSTLGKTEQNEKQTETVTLSGGLALGIFSHF